MTEAVPCTHAMWQVGAGRIDEFLRRARHGVITASGVGPVEFAREIFEELGAFSASDREVWYRLFKYGETPPA